MLKHGESQTHNSGVEYKRDFAVPFFPFCLCAKEVTHAKQAVMIIKGAQESKLRKGVKVTHDDQKQHKQRSLWVVMRR